MQGGDPTGHSLGGSSSAAFLSADEIRQRRLAALDRRPGATSRPVAIERKEENVAATVMSMPLKEKQEPPVSSSRSSNFADATAPSAASLQKVPAASPASLPATLAMDKAAPSKIFESAKPFDVLSFHKIMWDDQLTTESDKNRWVSQGIDIRRDTIDMDTTSSPSTTTATPAAPSNMLDAVSATHLPWGLVQHHGGPCGVLAAIQAEMLRMLLFASSSPKDDDPIPGSPDIVAAAHCLTSDQILTALARSIALILARATLTPSAVEPSKKQTSNSVRIVLPTNHAAASNSDDTSLMWQDLEPWHPNTTTATTTNGNSMSLAVYSIPVDDDTSNIIDHHQSPQGSSATAKRQKTQEVDGSSSNHSLASRIHRLARTVEAFLLDTTSSSHVLLPPLEHFRRHGGVLLLVMSLTASRSNAILQQEFDDPVGTRLTAQFGHCGQELINLLLTGQAVSNVFDNTLKPSGEMVCRGIQHRPAIGYLSQLESMRYCEVGGYYKSPIFPIWVVGSTSHFTVLFGDPASLKESKSDMLLDECRRAFKAVEGGEENGFITTEQLGTVLETLKIDVGGATQIETLAASLQVSGAGIILWDDFWKAASRLLTGASLEAVLQGGDGSASSNPIIVDDGDEPPPLITNFPANPEMHQKPTAIIPAAAAAAPVNHMETDEEMARRLAAEWGDSGVGMSALSNVASAATPMEVEHPSVLSDEEMARKLQDEWNNESMAGIGDSSVAAVNGSPIPTSSDMDDIPPLIGPDGTLLLNTVEEEEDSKPASKPAAKDDGHAFEQFGDSFSLYHYNGLRGGMLTPFRITRLSAEEAVGASIALNRGAGGSSHGAGGSQDLEDVVRTKWPSCAINWLGKQPPYID